MMSSITGASSSSGQSCVCVWVKGFEATDTAFRNSRRYLAQIAARYPRFKVRLSAAARRGS
jgi:hypothetical protein